MRPIYGCHENFRDSRTTPTVIFPKFLIVPIDRVNMHTKFKVRSFLPVPWLIGVAKKFGAVPGYALTLYPPPPKKKKKSYMPTMQTIYSQIVRFQSPGSNHVSCFVHMPNEKCRNPDRIFNFFVCIMWPIIKFHIILSVLSPPSGGFAQL